MRKPLAMPWDFYMCEKSINVMTRQNKITFFKKSFYQKADTVNFQHTLLYLFFCNKAMIIHIR